MFTKSDLSNADAFVSSASLRGRLCGFESLQTAFAAHAAYLIEVRRLIEFLLDPSVVNRGGNLR